tara:strand:- start:83 stop:256 length:174 start_codon:yes stop_codon:yes gene_type:complete
MNRAVEVLLSASHPLSFSLTLFTYRFTSSESQTGNISGNFGIYKRNVPFVGAFAGKM